MSCVVGCANGCGWATPLTTYNAVIQVDVVAGNADQALDQEEVLRLAIRVKLRLGRRLDEHDHVVALRFAVVNQRHPLCGRRKGNAVDYKVVAHQKRLLHGPRRNNKILRDKRENEQSHNQHRADAGDRLERRFLHLFFVYGIGIFLAGTGPD